MRLIRQVGVLASSQPRGSPSLLCSVFMRRLHRCQTVEKRRIQFATCQNVLQLHPSPSLHLQLIRLGDARYKFGDCYVSELQRLWIDRGIRRYSGKETPHVVPNLPVERNACSGCQQLREAKYIVEVLSHVFGIHLGALRFSLTEFKPCNSLQW